MRPPPARAELNGGGVFSWPCFIMCAPGAAVDLCSTLSSTKTDSSVACTLFRPGDRGVTTLCGRPSLMEGSRTGGTSFMPSRAFGSSLAPGGTVFLLGLPWGVLAGLMKLLRLGVPGRSVRSCFPVGKRVPMKLAMARRVARLTRRFHCAE